MSDREYTKARVEADSDTFPFSIDARLLHSALLVSAAYPVWIKSKMNLYNLKKEKDYKIFTCGSCKGDLVLLAPNAALYLALDGSSQKSLHFRKALIDALLFEPYPGDDPVDEETRDVMTYRAIARIVNDYHKIMEGFS
jgi:hypothetical protein